MWIEIVLEISNKQNVNLSPFLNNELKHDGVIDVEYCELHGLMSNGSIWNVSKQIDTVKLAHVQISSTLSLFCHLHSLLCCNVCVKTHSDITKTTLYNEIDNVGFILHHTLLFHYIRSP